MTGDGAAVIVGPDDIDLAKIAEVKAKRARAITPASDPYVDIH